MFTYPFFVPRLRQGQTPSKWSARSHHADIYFFLFIILRRASLSLSTQTHTHTRPDGIRRKMESFSCLESNWVERLVSISLRFASSIYIMASAWEFRLFVFLPKVFKWLLPSADFSGEKLLKFSGFWPLLIVWWYSMVNGVIETTHTHPHAHSQLLS